MNYKPKDKSKSRKTRKLARKANFKFNKELKVGK